MQIANRHMKRCSTSLIIRKIQIKTTMQYYFTSVRMAIIKRQEITTLVNWWGYGEKGILMYYWWESKLVQPLWKTVWRFLKKLKINLPYSLATLFLDIYPKKAKTLISKDTCTPMFRVALFTTVKIWRQPKFPSTDEWIRKMWCIHTREYYSAVKMKHCHLQQYGQTWRLSY